MHNQQPAATTLRQGPLKPLKSTLENDWAQHSPVSWVAHRVVTTILLIAFAWIGFESLKLASDAFGELMRWPSVGIAHRA